MSPISHAAAWDAMFCELFQDKHEFMMFPQIRSAYIQIIRQCAERGYVNISHESIRVCVLFSTHVATKQMAHLMRRQAPSKNSIYSKIQKLHFSEEIRCRLFGCGDLTYAILETAKKYFEGIGVERSLERGFYWCSLIQETNEKGASLSSCWMMVRELAQYLEPEYRPSLE